MAIGQTSFDNNGPLERCCRRDMVDNFMVWRCSLVHPMAFLFHRSGLMWLKISILFLILLPSLCFFHWRIWKQVHRYRYPAGRAGKLLEMALNKRFSVRYICILTFFWRNHYDLISLYSMQGLEKFKPRDRKGYWVSEIIFTLFWAGLHSCKAWFRAPI